jgi:predicted nicotinamide N-methyase
MNATLNGVVVECREEIDMEKAPKHCDVIIAGDVCYQQAMSAKLMRWLWICFAQGIRVFLADPGRAYLPREGLIERARYEVPTSRDLEDRDSRIVVVWELSELPSED